MKKLLLLLLFMFNTLLLANSTIEDNKVGSKFVWVSDKEQKCSIYVDKYFILKHSWAYDRVDRYVNRKNYVHELRWIGNCKNGKATGIGKADIDDGLFLLEGNFDNGKLNGKYYVYCTVPHIDEEEEEFEGVISFKNSIAIGDAYLWDGLRVFIGNFKNNTFTLQEKIEDDEDERNKKIVTLIEDRKYQNLLKNNLTKNNCEQLQLVLNATVLDEMSPEDEIMMACKQSAQCFNSHNQKEKAFEIYNKQLRRISNKQNYLPHRYSEIDKNKKALFNIFKNILDISFLTKNICLNNSSEVCLEHVKSMHSKDIDK